MTGQTGRGSMPRTGGPVREWRLRMGLSQAQCAALYGCSERTWRRYDLADEAPKRVSHWLWRWEFHDRHNIETRATVGIN